MVICCRAWSGTLGNIYAVLKDFAGTFVLAACLAAMYRRIIIKPERYAVPAKYGKEHTWEAVLVLMLIIGLVTCDMVFEGSLAAAQIQKGLKPEIHGPDDRNMACRPYPKIRTDGHPPEFTSGSVFFT